MRFLMLLIAGGMVVFTFLTGCSDDDESTAPTETTRFTFNFSNMAPLDSANYQAWALIGNFGFPISMFNFNESRQMVDADGNVVADNAFSLDINTADVQGIGISVEPLGSTHTGPDVLLLGGTVSDGSATLTIEHSAGFGASFDAISGKYILATPTNGVDTDEFSGIWFIDNSSSITVRGLTLPDPGVSSWVYEGWVNVDDTYLSTGIFVSTTVADDSSKYNGSTAPPAFPGEDFLTNAPVGVTFPPDLRGRPVMITLEMFPDPNPAPSPYGILRATIPADAADHQTYQMDVIADSTLPSGSVTLVTE